MRSIRDAQALVRTGVFAVLCTSVVASAGAQEQQPRVAFEHDGQGASGFALYAQPSKGKVIRIDLGLVPPGDRGIRAAPLPMLPEGDYALSVAAYNAAGESSRVPVVPGRIVVKRVDAQAVGAANSSGQAPQTPSVQVPAASPPNPEKSGTGSFGRLWRILVGPD